MPESGLANGLSHRGAEKVDARRFPYLCSLRKAGDRKHVCTATLVRQRRMVAPAHCVDPDYPKSVGFYPLVYCGVTQSDDASAEKVSLVRQGEQRHAPLVSQTFHVVEARMHPNWTGSTVDGHDLAVLRIDKKAKVPLPRLLREGMPLRTDMRLSTVDWRTTTQKGSLSERRTAHWATLRDSGECKTSSASLGPVESLVCVCSRHEDAHNGSGNGILPAWTRQDLVVRVVSVESGALLLLADRPEGDLVSGDPAEDLIIGISPVDIAERKASSRNGGGSGIYTSVRHASRWITETIDGKTSEVCSSSFAISLRCYLSVDASSGSLRSFGTSYFLPRFASWLRIQNTEHLSIV